MIKLYYLYMGCNELGECFSSPPFLFLDLDLPLPLCLGYICNLVFFFKKKSFKKVQLYLR